MTRLLFALPGVQEIIEHALAAERHKMDFVERMETYGADVFDAQPDEEERAKPALWWVKDEGIYLMSNGVPALLRDPAAPEDKQRSKVVYAMGFDPTKSDRGEVWDAARAAVGGDDFVESISLTNADWIKDLPTMFKSDAAKDLAFVIDVDGSKFSMVVVSLKTGKCVL